MRFSVFGVLKNNRPAAAVWTSLVGRGVASPERSFVQNAANNRKEPHKKPAQLIPFRKCSKNADRQERTNPDVWSVNSAQSSPPSRRSLREQDCSVPGGLCFK